MVIERAWTLVPVSSSSLTGPGSCADLKIRHAWALAAWCFPSIFMLSKGIHPWTILCYSDDSMIIITLTFYHFLSRLSFLPFTPVVQKKSRSCPEWSMASAQLHPSMENCTFVHVECGWIPMLAQNVHDPHQKPARCSPVRFLGLLHSVMKLTEL